MQQGKRKIYRGVIAERSTPALERIMKSVRGY
jgi:hypothetical protein